MFFRMVYKSG